MKLMVQVPVKYLPNPSHIAGCDTRSISKGWFEFIVFLLLDWLPNQGLRTESALLFIDN